MDFQNREYATPWDGVIPPKSKIGTLSAEIAGEGFKVSGGPQESWTPPKRQDMTPDWSQFKSIQKYFNRSGFPPFPSWIYHPTEQPRIVKNADEAAEYGIIFREATDDERSMGQGAARYDFVGGTQWRVKPLKDPKFDHTNPGPAKNYESPKPDYLRSQTDLLRGMVAALQEGNKGSIRLEDLVAALTASRAVPEPVEPIAEPEDDERATWLKAAEERGVKVDKRWSLERLRNEVAKAGE